MIFLNRTDAGKKLVEKIEKYLFQYPKPEREGVVYGLARGGVIVAAEVARMLGMPLDVWIVQKIGAWSNPEYAIGAISEGGEVVRSEEAAKYEQFFNQEQLRLRDEILRRQKLYRGNRIITPCAGKIAIIVDDGVATGLSIFAAIRDIKKLAPKKIILAVPVAPPDVFSMLSAEVDEAIALELPEPFGAVGNFYDQFGQVEDGEVIKALKGR